MKKYFFIFLIVLFFQRCSNDPEPVLKKNLPAQWADMTLYTIQHTPPNSPTYTSRNLGYIGLTMYESVVHGSSVHRSMSGQLNGLGELPAPQAGLPLPQAGVEYNWSISLNAAQAFILKSFYPHAQPQLTDAINKLESSVYASELITTSADVAERSALFGKAVAESIYEWSKTDGGHNGYLNQFDFTYEMPVGPGHWAPPFFGQSVSTFPLHAHWGDNRTFVAANATLPVPDMVSYSTDAASAYRKLFEEVYAKRKSLTSEEKRIAAWWADDPTETASPPGHSYNLATIAITSSGADLFTSAEVYAKVGLAVADAFICCWKCKYTYHSERPYPYIKAFIDNAYEPFWPEPPFPAFSSGHATQSAAAAIALISVFGDHFSLVDDTHARRAPDFENIPYRSRKFTNLWATATECAYSRFLGGIHTRMDNEAGTEQGKRIGELVTALEWRHN